MPDGNRYIRIKVLFFASVRETMGKAELEMDIPEDYTSGELRTLLVKKRPELAKIVLGSRFAINESFADWNQKLRENDVIAVIPPVSGG